MANGALPASVDKSKFIYHYVAVPAVIQSGSSDNHTPLETVSPVSVIENSNGRVMAREYNNSQIFFLKITNSLTLVEFVLNGAGSLSIDIDTSLSAVDWYPLPNWTTLVTTTNALLRIENLKAGEFLRINVTYTGSNKYHVNAL